MKRSSKIQYILAMLVFGSVGVFIQNMSLPSAAIIQWRCLIGSIFLLICLLPGRTKLDLSAVKQNLPALLFAGTVLGFGWAALFETYRYTSVGVATLLYYCAPIVVFFLSFFIFREKPDLKQTVGILSAILGMVVINMAGAAGGLSPKGLMYGMAAALFYAALVISNKFIHGVPGLVRTWIQLMTALVIMSVYTAITTGQLIHMPTGNDIPLILTVGILHTGFAYGMYVTSMQKLPGQTLSVLSYIDPASALFFAFLFLGEKLALYQAVGAVLIFGGTIFSQLPKKENGDQPELLGSAEEI